MGASSSRARASTTTCVDHAAAGREEPPPPLHHGSAAVAVRSSGHHVLEIRDYSLLKAITPNGKSINSVSFMVGGHSWHLRYYPNGCNADRADYVSVFLVLEDGGGADEPVNVQLRFCFVDMSNHDQNEPPSEAAVGDRVYGFDQHRTWGDMKKKEELERDGLIVEDQLAIRCDIVVITLSCMQTTTTNVAAATASFVDVPPADPCPHLCALFSSMVGTDMTFKVGKRRFTAHRCVLADRSPVFMAKHYGQTKKKTNRKRVIRIDDMKPKVFDALLTFMYTDSLPEMNTRDEVAIALRLLVAADKYDLKRLKLVCEDKLCKHVNKSTVINMLAFVDQRPSCKGLKKACFGFLVKLPQKTLEKVIATEAFDHLAANCTSVVKELLLSTLSARG